MKLLQTYKNKRKSTNLLQCDNSRENKVLYPSTFLLCVTQFICSWDTRVAVHGSISHLIAISLFGLSHRTKFLLNTITKQQNKSCFAQVLAKAVEETPLQKERITQITFGSISASTRGRGFQEQNYRLGKTLKSSQQHKWNLENRKAHAESSVWRASVGVCQEEVLRTSAEPPLWLYIGKTALQFLLCSVLPAIELF